VDLVLASASPRREQLLAAAGYTFTTTPVEIDEDPTPGESPADYVVRLALRKAEAAACRNPGKIVLGADTTVVVSDKILSKPVSRAEAIQMLKMLSGRWHEVLTGVALCFGDRRLTAVSCTRVRFLRMTEDEINWYVSTGEPFDKAGGYGIQGLGSRFVDRIEGSYSNVVGLPVAVVHRLLKQLGGGR
jgi:septum formation protein